MIQAADWAFIAGLLNAGNARVYVDSQGKLFLSAYFPRVYGQAVSKWLKLQGREFRADAGRKGVSYRTRFIGAEAVKVLNKCYDRLLEPGLKRRADLAFRYWRTMQLPGQRLPVEARTERELVLQEFVKLKTLRVKRA